jgi:hypothetical protein
MHLIKVTPLALGWRVCTQGLANDMVFKSGRAAELAARSLAARLSRAGQSAEVLIELRDNSIGARFSLPPARSKRELEAA